MAKRHRGRSTVFSTPQNQALRVELKVQGAKYASERAFGEALGIAQQNVGRLLKDRRAGFGYSTATVLVRMAGFASVDAFFAARGVAAPESGTSVDAGERVSA